MARSKRHCRSKSEPCQRCNVESSIYKLRWSMRTRWDIVNVRRWDVPEILRMISGTSHFRTLTISDLVLKLHLGFLKNIMCYHHMMTVSIVNMTFHTCHDAICKIHKCAKCANLHNLEKSSKSPKCEKHHFGGGQKSTYFGVQKCQFRMQPPVEIPPNYVLFSIPPPPQIWPNWGISQIWHFPKNPKMLTRREFGNSRDV